MGFPDRLRVAILLVISFIHSYFVIQSSTYSAMQLLIQRFTGLLTGLKQIEISGNLPGQWCSPLAEQLDAVQRAQI